MVTAVKNASLDLRHIKIFLTVVEKAGVRAAAAALGMSPAAVSQAVAALEANLAVTLFERDTRPLKLTAAGRRLLEDGEALLRSVQRIRTRVVSEEMTFQKLRLGMGESVATTSSPWLLNRLLKRVAGLSVCTDSYKPLVTKLRDDQLDVILCAGVDDDDERWVREEAYREELLLVTSKDCPEIRSTADLQKAVRDRPVLTETDGSADQERVKRILGAMNASPVQEIAVSSSYAFVGLVAEAGGLGIMPPTSLWCGRQFLEAVRFQPLPGGLRAQRSMWVSGSADRSLEQVELVRKELQSVIRENMQPEMERTLSGLSGFVYVSD